MHLFTVGGLMFVLATAALVDPHSLGDRDRTPLGSDPVIFVPADEGPKPIPDFVERGMEWLANAQFENGGWGAGSHARQDVRDPRVVKIDPATTAFSAMALMRSGSTLSSGPYRRNIASALDYLLGLVEQSPENDPRLSNITGTQPQAKLGQNIDVSMVTQFLSEILIYTEHDQDLHDRVASALDVCLHKLETSQDADGSWNSQAGWAGVLQTAMANNALERAGDVGREVDEEALEKSRSYQRDAIDVASGGVRTEDAAGIPLYSIASNQRATAKEAKVAEDAVIAGAAEGEIESPDVSEENLEKMGFDEADARRLAGSYRSNKAAEEMIANDAVLTGFGNNGGEEFLSYMMTSESLVVSGSETWTDWHSKMRDRLSKVQNANGSWSGHHCITSPVFCTAAVILTITADRGGFADNG